ncbi:MAG: thioredoxin family protein [Labilithrix sp.]|jgi:peroxiredoxin|nr:thioredoxin family protein [Labilithrix sp.]
MGVLGIVLPAIMLVAPAFAAAACSPAIPPSTIGMPAPKLAFAYAGGGEHRSESTNGNVVVLAFFTVWCPSSAAMLRALEDIRVRAKDARGLTIVAIDEGDRPEDVTAFGEKLGVNLRLGLDKGGVAANQMGLVTVPSVLVIDRAGVVRHVHSGFHGSDDLEAIEREVTALVGHAYDADD